MRRSMSLAVIPAILLVLIIAPFVLYWSSLPSPMAIHWGIGGEPNGSAPPFLLLLILAGLYAVIVLSVRRVVAATPGEAPSFVAGLYAIGALLASGAWISVLANKNVDSWRVAGAVGWIHISVILVVAVGAGAAGWYQAGGAATLEGRAPGVAPRIDVADPDSAVWSGRGTGKLVTAAGIAVIVVGLINWGWTGLVLALVGIAVLMFASVRVTVAKGGVVVSLGWWGLPMWRVPLDGVARAEVEAVQAFAYGGWGYRVRPGVRATVVRSGDGLRLVRNDRPDLVYTVDDAATGAGLINAIIGARR